MLPKQMLGVLTRTSPSELCREDGESRLRFMESLTYLPQAQQGFEVVVVSELSWHPALGMEDGALTGRESDTRLWELFHGRII